MMPALPAGCTIALLGAERTGKTELARALAARLRGRGVTVADGTPLGAAVSHELLTGDRSPYAGALAAQRRFAYTLLMGLDLPWPAELGPASSQRRERTDALLRAALAGAQLPFAVIHGRGSERLANACNAIGAGDCGSGPELAPWSCDKCSDPACEHRLFTALLGRRREAGTVA
ncbi:ATPase [Variovorax sp. M-6]|uniref:ATPase n=1 Tax=Variovorax sp. M-6 TaxID=3233041 RepID=UPI003F97311A